MAYKNTIRQQSTMVALALRGEESGASEVLVALVNYAAAARIPLEQLADLLAVSRTAIRGWMAGHTVSTQSNEAVATLTRVLGVGISLGVLPAPEGHFEPVMKLLKRAVALRVELDEMTATAAALRTKYEIEVTPDVAASYADEEVDADEDE